MSGEAVGELIGWGCFWTGFAAWVLAGLYGLAIAITVAIAEIGRRYRIIGLFCVWAHERMLDRRRNGARG